MNSVMIFLVIVLVSALLLFAMVTQGGQHRRRRGGGGFGGHKGGSNHRSSPAPNLTREQIFVRWQTIQTMAIQGGGNGLRQAVIEADKLLDHVMRSGGASGDTMGDRLRSFQNRFSDRDQVWRAHKMRNALAHDVAFDLVPSQAREALAGFERALKDLGAL